MRFTLLLIVFFPISLNLSAQQRTKFVPIQLDLHSTGEQVEFTVRGYTLVFNQNDLLRAYESHSQYANILAIIRSDKVLELDEVYRKFKELGERNRCYIPNLKRHINRCFESGQVIVLTPQNRQLRLVNLEIQEESFFSYDAYSDPVSGELIFTHVISLPGCPSF